ncbi:putative cellular morphogenesis protein [Patellaria atrata CBS 101060]|uniref:Cellular morphogenesis protein n=1 Tax=Patellaria atrata CBS 101060 TaxID=1346257 RepID=A0A9P4S6K9_9PEZI|nr:putative cellular morphogenesis protein [Patellaria atrata CBS 101060]
MRKLTSLLGSTETNLATLLLAISSLTLHNVAAFDFNPVPSPNLDLDQLGRVALAGDFDSISLYQYEGQTQNGFSSNGTQSVLARFPNGVFTSVSNADAHIETMCSFVDKAGRMHGVVVGGNFTSLGSDEANGVALVNHTTGSITPLPGLNGRVTSLLCDRDGGIVYVGGSFSGGNSTNAIAWVTGWTNLPFAGFNGPVRSIVKGPRGRIIFGGSFDGLGNTTAPETPDEQDVPISSANITADGSSLDPSFSDPRNIVCKTNAGTGVGNSWLLADNRPGSWTANFAFGFNPTKIRLWNTPEGDRGTKTWRFTALPLGGILNLTFADPETGETRYCDQTCPLPDNNSTAQDFFLVNKPIGMNAFRIDISDWYGSGGGLAGIQLSQDDIYTFAIDDFNSPKCTGEDVGASSTSTGPWAVTPSGQSSSSYLTASLTGDDIGINSAQVVFRPNIKQSGNYSVTVYTPGCIQDDTCDSRGRVNITGVMGSGTRSSNRPMSTELFQTNNFDKYDRVYFGYVDATSDSFQPAVTLAPSNGQQGDVTIVAQRVRFELLSSEANGLNGLFEYNPNQAEIDTDFSASAINRAGIGLNSQALITSLAVQDNTLFVAGDFENRNYSNIFSIEGNDIDSLPGGGLNSGVFTLYHKEDDALLYVGGNFTSTRDNRTDGLKGVAAYSIEDGEWQPLGAGVHGFVMEIVPFTLNLTADEPEDVISINGYFDRVHKFGNNTDFPAQNFAIWVPSRRNWLNNLNINTISITGRLTATTETPDSEPLWAGSVSSQGNSASGAVAMTNSDRLALQNIPVKIQPKQISTESSRKRAINGQNLTGVVAGLIHQEGGFNLTILGGHFTAMSSNGSQIDNLLIMDGDDSDKVFGIGNSVDTDSTYMALAIHGSTLFAGGIVSGDVNGDELNGLVLYDLNSKTLGNDQPPAFSGSDVAVNAIRPRPESGNVYVGGNFESAGSFPCPGLCVFDTSRTQWSSPGAGLSGNVATMAWVTKDQLIIGGNLTVGGNTTTLATYDADDQKFQEITGAGSLPGPVTALTAANEEGSQFWVAGQDVNGAAYLQKFDGKKWVSIGDDLDQGTIIRGLQVFSLQEDHDDSKVMENDQVLMILGTLNIPNFGNASAALYDGQKFTPFILANTASNTGGSLSQAFVQKQNFFKPGRGGLAIGFIVLIALAIALALTFLIVVAGIIAERIRRKREGYMPAPTHAYDKTSNMGRIPPETLLQGVGSER